MNPVDKIMQLMGEAAEELDKLKANTKPGPFARQLAVALTLLQQAIAWLGYYVQPVARWNEEQGYPISGVDHIEGEATEK